LESVKVKKKKGKFIRIEIKMRPVNRVGFVKFKFKKIVIKYHNLVGVGFEVRTLHL
jgi:hypothetical protein